MGEIPEEDLSLRGDLGRAEPERVKARQGRFRDIVFGLSHWMLLDLVVVEGRVGCTLALQYVHAMSKSCLNNILRS